MRYSRFLLSRQFHFHVPVRNMMEATRKQPLLLNHIAGNTLTVFQFSFTVNNLRMWFDFQPPPSLRLKGVEGQQVEGGWGRNVDADVCCRFSVSLTQSWQPMTNKTFIILHGIYDLSNDLFRLFVKNNKMFMGNRWAGAIKRKTAGYLPGRNRPLNQSYPWSFGRTLVGFAGSWIPEKLWTQSLSVLKDQARNVALYTKICQKWKKQGEQKLNCQYFHVICLVSRGSVFALMFEFLVIIFFN